MDIKALERELANNNKLVSRIRDHIDSDVIDLITEIELTKSMNELIGQILILKSKIDEINLDTHNNRPLSNMDSLLLNIDVEDAVISSLPLYAYNHDDIRKIDYLLNENNDNKLVPDIIREFIMGDRGDSLFETDDSFVIGELENWFNLSELYRKAIIHLHFILSNNLYIPSNYKYSHESRSEKDMEIVYNAIKKYINHNYKNYFND